MLPLMKASGLVRSNASMVWSSECPLERATPAAISDKVWPARTAGNASPACVAAAADALAVARAAASVLALSCAARSATGAGSRAIALLEPARGASMAGSAIAAAVLGASTKAEYSRTSRPWPHSTSIRKLIAGWSTAWLLVTRITARPRASCANWNCRLLTSPCGRSRPTRANVVADASATRALSSSPGSLEMTGISATSGCPGLDSTRISPSPNAIAAPLQAISSNAPMPCIGRIAPPPLCFMGINIAAG